MKKLLPFILCSLAVFLFGLFIIPYTLMMQEQFALFLTTPDWMSETFSAPWPLCHLAANALLQFFYFRWGGPLILALLTCLMLLLLSLPFKGKARVISRWTLTGLLAITLIILSLNGNVSKQEQFSAVEYSAQKHDWTTVLHLATPEATRHDRELLPYALLALTESGQLPEHMMAYPVRDVDDFCPSGWNTRRGLHFKAILYECMGIPLEAIHNTFQEADALPHGMSFGALRTLIRLNRLTGNDLLADKYRYILGHSTLHRSYPMPQSAQTMPQTDEDTSRTPLIVPDYFYNVTTLMSQGISTPAMVDRSLCGLLLRRDLIHFNSVWKALPHTEGEAIPSIYKEALYLSNSSLWSKASGPYTRFFMQQKQ